MQGWFVQDKLEKVYIAALNMRTTSLTPLEKLSPRQDFFICDACYDKVAFFYGNVF